MAIASKRVCLVLGVLLLLGGTHLFVSQVSLNLTNLKGFNPGNDDFSDIVTSVAKAATKIVPSAKPRSSIDEMLSLDIWPTTSNQIGHNSNIGQRDQLVVKPRSLEWGRTPQFYKETLDLFAATCEKPNADTSQCTDEIREEQNAILEVSTRLLGPNIVSIDASDSSGCIHEPNLSYRVQLGDSKKRAIECAPTMRTIVFSSTANDEEIPTSIDHAVHTNVGWIDLVGCEDPLSVINGARWTLKTRKAPIITMEWTLQHATTIPKLHSSLVRHGYALYAIDGCPKLSAEGSNVLNDAGVSCIGNAVSDVYRHIVLDVRRPSIEYAKNRLQKETVEGLASSLADHDKLTVIAIRESDMVFNLGFGVEPPANSPYGIRWSIQSCDECTKSNTRRPNKRDMRDCQRHSDALACEFYAVKVMLIVGVDLDRVAEAAASMTALTRIGVCDKSKRYKSALDMEFVLSVASTAVDEQRVETAKTILRDSVQDMKHCFRGPPLVTKRVRNPDWHEQATWLYPSLEGHVGTYDYAVLVPGADIMALQNNWLDSLYEHIVVTPDVIFHEGSTSHITKFNNSMGLLDEVPRSAFGIYSVEDPWAQRLYRNADRSMDPGSALNSLTHNSDGNGPAEWMRLAHRLRITETIMVQLPAHFWSNITHFSEGHPDTLLVVRSNIDCVPHAVSETGLVLPVIGTDENDLSGGRRGVGVCSEFAHDTDAAEKRGCFGCPDEPVWTEGDGEPLRGWVDPLDSRTCADCVGGEGQRAYTSTQREARLCAFHKSSGRVRCRFEQKKLAFVMALNYKQWDELIVSVTNYSMSGGFPCDPSKRLMPTMDYVFRYIREVNMTADDVDLKNKEILSAMGDSISCFDKVIFEQVETPSEFQDDYHWAPCTYFFGSFEALRGRYDYMFFMEQDIGAVRPYWADEFAERVHITPEHAWQLSSIGRYNEIFGARFFDLARNGVGLYRLGDPYFDTLLRRGARACPAPFDATMDKIMTQDMQMFTSIWHRFVISDVFQNCGPVFEYLDMDWFNQMYPDTFFVHKVYRYRQKCFEQGTGYKCGCYHGCPVFADGYQGPNYGF